MKIICTERIITGVLAVIVIAFSQSFVWALDPVVENVKTARQLLMEIPADDRGIEDKCSKSVTKEKSDTKSGYSKEIASCGPRVGATFCKERVRKKKLTQCFDKMKKQKKALEALLKKNG